MATLPTENLRRIAAREVYASPTGGNVALVFAAEAELILRDMGFGGEHSLAAIEAYKAKTEAPDAKQHYLTGPDKCGGCGYPHESCNCG